MGKKKRKKKSQKRGPRRKRMRREARLASAPAWLPTYGGRRIAHAYARRYGVDLLCAVNELRLLGVKVSADYEAQIRASIEHRARERERKRKRAAPPPPEALIDSCREDWFADGSWYDADPAPDGWDDIPLADPEAVGDSAPDLWDQEQDEAEEPPIEDAFLDDVFALELKVIETTMESLEEPLYVRIVLEEDPDVLAARAWSLIFVLGVFSYADARPRRGSGGWFVEDDEWTVDDMLRRLSFDRGRLSFHADRVRGRRMAMTIEIDPGGRITLETVDRGEAAKRWIAKLQGKAVRPRPRGGARWGPIPF